MWQKFNCKVSNSVFSLEILIFAFNHYIEWFKIKRIKVTLQLIMIYSTFLKLNIFFRSFTHQCTSIFSSKKYKYFVSKIRYFCSYHIDRNTFFKYFIAILTSPLIWSFFNNFSFANRLWTSHII